MPKSLRRISARKLSLSIIPVGLMATLGLAAPSLATAKAKTLSGVEPETCPGQLFSQPFASLEDLRYYLLAPGGEFNGPSSEGWSFTGGAHLVSAVRPSGVIGGALDLPAGAVAVSPPICVTLAYPIARVWVNGVSGEKGVGVAVSYAGTTSELEPKAVGKVLSPNGAWTLGEFNVDPRLAGKEAAAREVRFVFTGHHGSESRLYDLFIDPRLHH